MQGLRLRNLFPRGFVVERATGDDGGFVIGIKLSASVCRCPMCGAFVAACTANIEGDWLSSGRRRANSADFADAPLLLGRCGLRAADLCRTVRDGRAKSSTDEPPRRCGPLSGIALGGGSVASLSRRLNVEVSNDTLLRIVRRRGSRRCPPPTIVGIDDWAWRRNHRRPWLEHPLARVSGKSGIADELRYGLNPWEGLVRFLDDGCIELDTNIVERAIRPIVLNRKNALFAGH
jgi:Transposase IS66 family